MQDRRDLREGLEGLQIFLFKNSRFDRFVGRFVGSNTDGLFDRINKNFTVTNFPGFSCIDHS